MKIVAIIARYLLGAAFTFFGLNGLFQFMKYSEPAGLAGEWVHAMNVSHYMSVIAALYVVSGILLLVNRFVPLALTLLGPILFNILVFHIVFDPKSIGMGLFCTILWALVLVRVWPSFAALVQPTGQA